MRLVLKIKMASRDQGGLSNLFLRNVEHLMFHLNHFRRTKPCKRQNLPVPLLKSRKKHFRYRDLTFTGQLRPTCMSDHAKSTNSQAYRKATALSFWLGGYYRYLTSKTAKTVILATTTPLSVILNNIINS